MCCGGHRTSTLRGRRPRPRSIRDVEARARPLDSAISGVGLRHRHTERRFLRSIETSPVRKDGVPRRRPATTLHVRESPTGCPGRRSASCTRSRRRNRRDRLAIQLRSSERIATPTPATQVPREPQRPVICVDPSIRTSLLGLLDNAAIAGASGRGTIGSETPAASHGPRAAHRPSASSMLSRSPSPRSNPLHQPREHQ